MLTLGAPLVLLGVLLAHVALYIGWRREARFGDLDREWLARLNGTTFAFIAAWTLFAAACILPSRWITLPDGAVHGVNITMSGLGAIVSGALSSWLGKQAISRVTDDLKGGGIKRLTDVAQLVLPLIFVVLLFAFLSALIQDILGTAAGWLPATWLEAGEACDRIRTAERCAWIGRWVPVGTADRAGRAGDRRGAEIARGGQRQPVLDARGLSQPAGARLPGNGARSGDAAAGSVHRLRRRRQPAAGDPDADRAAVSGREHDAEHHHR